MKKILPFILTILTVLTACGTNLPENPPASDIPSFSNETFTTTAVTAASGDFPEGFPVPEGVTRTFTGDGYLFYYTDIIKGDSRFNEICALNLETLETIDIFATHLNLAVQPGDEYFSDQQFLTKNFTFDHDGWVNIYVLTDYDTDGFHKRWEYRKNIETLQIEELGSMTSEKPFTEYVPENKEVINQWGVVSVKLDIDVPENGTVVNVNSLEDWEAAFSAPPPEEGITLMEQFGNYICYRYEYIKDLGEYNNIISGLGYVDVLTMVKNTIREFSYRDPASFTDEFEAALTSTYPQLIPNGFVMCENVLYYYTYSQWSDENFAKLENHLTETTPGFYMRSIFLYDFETKYIQHGMWQDSAEPFPLTPEFTDPPLKAFEPPLATYDYTDAEYMSAANSAFFGNFAYDEDNVYYKNINDRGSLYRKSRFGVGPGTKLASANVAGNLSRISVWGDEVFFVTNYYDPEYAIGTEGIASIYAVKKDGSSEEPRGILSDVGDCAYIYDGVIYYTGGMSSGEEAMLFSVPLDAGLEGKVKIADFAMYVTIAEGMITYFDGTNVKVYDIAAGEVTFEQEAGVGIDSMFRYDNYIIYHYEYQAESRHYTAIEAIDITTGEVKEIARVLYEHRELVDDGSVIPMSYNIYNGLLMYNVLSHQVGGSYREKMLMGHDFLQWKEAYGVWSESEQPFYQNPPECALFSTPYGLYYYDHDGNLTSLRPFSEP
jgi:hypothetical protein